MRSQMFCRNRRIVRLTRLTHELGQSQTPEETFRALHRALADLHGFAASALLSTTGLPAGRYRVVVAGEPEAPVIEVVALSRDTSVLLLGFGLLLILGFVVAGVVVHRRWRDAIS